MGGRSPALTSKLREARLLLTDPDATVIKVADRYGMSRTTLYKGLGELAAREAKAAWKPCSSVTAEAPVMLARLSPNSHH